MQQTDTNKKNVTVFISFAFTSKSKRQIDKKKVIELLLESSIWEKQRQHENDHWSKEQQSVEVS